MSYVKTAPVVATRVDDIDADGVPAGAFEMRDPRGLEYICPCGCGRHGWLAFKPEVSPSWLWNGNRDKPTLEPSIHHRDHWHGYLRNGVWESC